MKRHYDYHGDYRGDYRENYNDDVSDSDHEEMVPEKKRSRLNATQTRPYARSPIESLDRGGGVTERNRAGRTKRRAVHDIEDDDMDYLYRRDKRVRTDLLQESMERLKVRGPCDAEDEGDCANCTEPPEGFQCMAECSEGVRCMREANGTVIRQNLDYDALNAYSNVYCRQHQTILSNNGIYEILNRRGRSMRQKLVALSMFARRDLVDRAIAAYK